MNFKHCPDCTATIQNDRCKCGWKFSHASKSYLASKPVCSVVEYAKACGSTTDVKRIGGTDENPIFWCERHYEQRRYKSSIELENEKRIELLKNNAREIGMSNREYCRDHISMILQSLEMKSRRSGQFPRKMGEILYRSA